MTKITNTEVTSPPTEVPVKDVPKKSSDNAERNSRIAATARNIFLTVTAVSLVVGAISFTVYVIVAGGLGWGVVFGGCAFFGIGSLVFGAAAHGLSKYYQPAPVVDTTDVTSFISPVIQVKAHIKTKDSEIKQREVKKGELVKEKKRIIEEQETRNNFLENVKKTNKEKESNLKSFFKTKYTDLKKIEDQINNPSKNKLLKTIKLDAVVNVLNNVINTNHQPTIEELNNLIITIKNKKSSEDIIGLVEAERDRLLEEIKQSEDTLQVIESQFNLKEQESKQKLIELEKNIELIETEINQLNTEKDGFITQLEGLTKEKGLSDEEILKIPLEKLPVSDLRKVVYDSLKNREKETFCRDAVTPVIHWFFKDIGNEKEAEDWLNSFVEVADLWKPEYDAKDEDFDQSEHSFFIKTLLYPIVRLEELKKEAPFKHMVKSLAEKPIDVTGIKKDLDSIVKCDEKKPQKRKTAKDKIEKILSGSIDFTNIPKETHFIVKELLSLFKGLLDKVNSPDDGKDYRERIQKYDLTTLSVMLTAAGIGKSALGVFFSEDRISSGLLKIVDYYWPIPSKKIEDLEKDIVQIDKLLDKEKAKVNNEESVNGLELAKAEKEERLKYEKARFNLTQKNKNMMMSALKGRHLLSSYFYIIQAIVDFYVILNDYSKDWENRQNPENGEEKEVVYLKRFAKQMQVIVQCGSPAIHQLAKELNTKYETCVDKCDKFITNADLPKDYTVQELSSWAEKNIQKIN